MEDLRKAQLMQDILTAISLVLFVCITITLAFIEARLATEQIEGFNELDYNLSIASCGVSVWALSYYTKDKAIRHFGKVMGGIGFIAFIVLKYF